MARSGPGESIVMTFLRHSVRFFRDIVGFAMENKAWWIIPVVIVLLLLALVIVATQTVSPFIYTLF